MTSSKSTIGRPDDHRRGVFLPERQGAGIGQSYFHGGEVFVSWLMTGEVRSYNTRGGYFNRISPQRPVFQAGRAPGRSWRRGAYADLDDGTFTGGKFWRVTPMLNWYLSDRLRLGIAYGYGSLNRFSTIGKTQFFQTRIQLQRSSESPHEAEDAGRGPPRVLPVRVDDAEVLGDRRPVAVDVAADVETGLLGGRGWGGGASRNLQAAA